jgi:hypothetical protein
MVAMHSDWGERSDGAVPYPSYPPPGYGHPGYPPPGYGPPGYGPPVYGPLPDLKPGIIALRPLNLSDIFNGAFAYVRANPKATLGLTTIVVVIAQLFALVLQISPLIAGGGLDSTYTGEDAPATALIGPTLGSMAGVIATWVSGIVLSGLLTVIVGRAVFGSGITIGAAWQRLRGRIWALLGFTVLEGLGAVLLIAVVAGITLTAVSWCIWAPCWVSSRHSSCWSACRSSPRSGARSR